MTLRSDQNKTHVEYLPRDPDGVTTAQKVFDTRCVDARGSESVRHLDALVAAKIARLAYVSKSHPYYARVTTRRQFSCANEHSRPTQPNTYHQKDLEYYGVGVGSRTAETLHCIDDLQVDYLPTPHWSPRALKVLQA